MLYEIGSEITKIGVYLKDVSKSKVHYYTFFCILESGAKCPLQRLQAAQITKHVHCNKWVTDEF